MHPFTCPVCGRTSQNPDDALSGYCGLCRDWTGPPPRPWGDPLADLRESMRGYLGREARMAPAYVPECPLTPWMLLDGPPWHYEGTEDEGRITVWRFDPLDAPWISCWRPDDSLGRCTVTWTGNRLELRVRTEVMARAVMARVPLAGCIGRSWDWEELRRASEEYRNREMPVAVLAGQQMLYGTVSEVQFAVSQDSGADVAAAARYFAGLRGPIDVSFALGGPLDIPFEIEAPGGRDETERYLTLRQAGFSSDEARCWAALGEAAAASSQSMADQGEAPTPAAMAMGRAPVMATMGPLPDFCPPPRRLPVTTAPAEQHADGGTAAVTMASDYDDPERVFL